MKTSREKISSQSSEVLHHFSHKRYFVNNLDSYHGTYILKELSKILERNQASMSKQSMQSVVGEDAAVLPPPPPEVPYEIVGTVTDPTLEKKGIPNVARIIPKDACLPQMLTCGTVIIDIGCDRNELKMAIDYTKLLEELLKKQALTESESVCDVEPAEGELKKRHLILISTVMTWAASKPLDPETPDMPFVEADFRKRKPHINYKMHYDIENEVVGIARKYKTQIGAIVVVPGVTYGAKEDVLYYWFQKTWECEKFLPIFGRGNNIIPLINVLDLAQIIYNLVNDFPKKLYMLAVEQNVTKQKEIVKPLGRAAGSGMFKCIPPEDAFLIPDIDQRTFDLMTLNLSMEPTFIVETMGLQWVSELPFVDNVPALMKQFKTERSLKPFKVVVYGPPIVGKTTLANLICENYGLIYISAETVVQDTMEDLEWRVAHWERGELADLPMPMDLEEEAVIDVGDEDLGDDEAVQEHAKITLAMLQSGRMLSDDEITGFLRQRMICREGSNRGWVLDGLPAMLAQTSIMFEKGDEADSEVGEENHEEQFDEDMDLYSNVLKKLLPDIVVSLEATDNYICEKAMRQPEGDSRLDEEVVLKRLNEFRTNDARDVTPLNFFDELDIHPLVIQVTEHTDYAMKCPYGKVALRMGRPCRYSKLIELIEAAEKREKQERDTQHLKEAKATKELEEKMQQDREDKMEYWSELLSLVREEEEAALAAAGEPMRNYLVHHIFPTLTPALLEVAKLRPEDPIDFLAEYLFKLNPSGKMLEPGYNLQSEKLLGKIKLLDDALQDLDIQIDPLMPDEKDDSAIQAEIRKDINAMSAM